jgi:carbon monoxide dehydrogenase subunit G
MKLEHAFEVPASPEQTLALLLDAERVVPCMPGASLTEVVDDRTWKAAMAVKLGPVGMKFLVDVKLLDRDDASHTVRLGVSGRDTRGKGGADGTVESVLAPVGAGGTRVEMATDLRFSGQVAQLGRPGVVQDVSNKLVDQFAACIKAQLSAEPEVAAAAVVEAQKPISGFSLAVAAFASAVKRLLGRGGGREKGGST